MKKSANLIFILQWTEPFPHPILPLPWTVKTFPSARSQYFQRIFHTSVKSPSLLTWCSGGCGMPPNQGASSISSAPGPAGHISFTVEEEEQALFWKDSAHPEVGEGHSSRQAPECWCLHALWRWGLAAWDEVGYLMWPLDVAMHAYRSLVGLGLDSPDP